MSLLRRIVCGIENRLAALLAPRFARRVSELEHRIEMLRKAVDGLAERIDEIADRRPRRNWTDF